MKNPRDSGDVSLAEEALGQKESGSGPHPLRPLDHLAFAILLDAGYDTADALGAVHRLHREFVDWNEIRVSRTQEIVRALGEGEKAERAAQRIKEEYNRFFDNKGALNFEFLAAGKPAEMRRLLVQQLPHLGKGAAALLLYEFCPGAPLPLSDEALRKVRRLGLAGKAADRGQLSRVLTESLPPDRICLLLQYWEIEAMGSPYGEAPRKDAAASKKSRKPATKEKAKATPGHI